MASRRNYFPSHFQSSNSIDHRFEFQESDIWNSDDAADHGPLKEIPIRSASRPWKKSAARNTPGNSSYSPAISAASSLPVNVPDWSKILGSGGGGGQWRRDVGGEDQDADLDGGDDDDDRVPPHEYAARQVARRSGMVVAFSVHEGVGRTLKGRDLSRVRNAIWKQTGSKINLTFLKFYLFIFNPPPCSECAVL